MIPTDQNNQGPLKVDDRGRGSLKRWLRGDRIYFVHVEGDDVYLRAVAA